MAGNSSPIFSRVGDIQGGVLLVAAATLDYSGQSVNNNVLFTADATNGGFVQKIRFKSTGTNVATVARIYHNNGNQRIATAIAAPAGTPTGTPSTTGGTLYAGNFFAKIVAVDQYGGFTVPSTESASVAITGQTGSITWAWTASTGAVSYRVYTGPVTGGQVTYFTTTSNSLVQTTTIGTRDSISNIQNNNTLIGEVSLPATTAIATAATVDIDYTLNIALPPSNRLLIGIGTAVAAGWFATAIGGAY